MDYIKTYQTYKDLGQEKKFESHPDFSRYKKEQGFFEKVKSPRTGDYYQAETLIQKELVPSDWKPPRLDTKGNPVKYPIISVNEIIRKRLPDESEWLLSRQEIIALDVAGNEINLCMVDKEKYNDILPVYALKPEDPKANPNLKDTKLVSKIDYLQNRIKYTEPFTPETAQRLWDMRNGKCSLCIIDEAGGSGDMPPISVSNFESFKNSSFQELYDLVKIPQVKMDRSYGDNLDHSHIG